MNLRKLAVHSKKNWIYFESSTDSHATNENPKGRFRVLFFFEIAEQARANEFFYLLGSLNDVFFLNYEKNVNPADLTHYLKS